MKTRIHTATKTAAGWMIIGGAAALAASFMLGSPFLQQKDTFQNQNVISNDRFYRLTLRAPTMTFKL